MQINVHLLAVRLVRAAFILKPPSPFRRRATVCHRDFAVLSRKYYSTILCCVFKIRSYRSLFSYRRFAVLHYINGRACILYLVQTNLNPPREKRRARVCSWRTRRITSLPTRAYLAGKKLTHAKNVFQNVNAFQWWLVRRGNWLARVPTRKKSREYGKSKKGIIFATPYLPLHIFACSYTSEMLHYVYSCRII